MHVLFRASVHCGNNPIIVKAEPKDLVIVCGEVSVEIENQHNSEENEVKQSLRNIVTYKTPVAFGWLLACFFFILEALF